MSLTLNDCIDPWKEAGRSTLVKGEISIKQLPRLAQVVLENDESISAQLSFEKNHLHLPTLTGEIAGLLTLTCNRCLQSMQLPVTHQFELVFSRRGLTTQEVLEQFDVHEVADERVCLSEIIEDELLLLIPQVPMHFDPVCIIETEFGEISDTQSTQEERENPFAVLASLKKHS